MRTIFLFSLILISQAMYAQTSMNIPKEPKGFPVSFLEELKIENPSKQLSVKERHDLAQLFIRCYVISIRKSNQDYTINPNSQVFQLFESNFPGISDKVGEGGIFLGAITKFLNTLPDYKSDIETVLREGVRNNKKCKERSS